MDSTRSDLIETIRVAEERFPGSRLVLDRRAAQAPSLQRILHSIGRLPDKTLFLGQAEDDRPVLLDLQDATVGPLLIKGGAGVGKTQFLQSMAQVVEFSHAPHAVQFGVITPHMEEWQQTLAEGQNCVGVFTSDGLGARRLIQSLAIWLHRVSHLGQVILLLVDGLDRVSSWNEDSQADLREVMTHGAAKNIWTMATWNPAVDMAPIWLELFGAQLIACQPPSQARSVWSCTATGPWFCMKENGGWTRFWIPSLGGT